MNNTGKKFGDKPDARYIRDVPGLTTIMFHIMPKRTESEVYLYDKIDATDLLKFIEKKNAGHPNYKTTVFHCFVLAVARMIHERPKMNRYVQGRRLYERDEISMSFLAKRRFADDAEEAFMMVVPKDNDNIDTVSHKIYGDLTEVRRHEHSTGGMDATVDSFAKIPRLLLMIVVRIIRWLDFWGLVPKALKEGDSNYGTNSIMITVGTLHKEEMVMPDGTKQIRDVLDFGATLDERIADGFYFVRSLRLVKYIFAHPELLDKPFSEPSGFDYDQKQ